MQASTGDFNQYTSDKYPDRTQLISPKDNNLLTSITIRLNFFLLAVIIGVVVSLATVALIESIALVQRVGYGDGSEERFASIAAAQPWWRLLLVPLIGGLIVGLLIQTLPGRRYHGIADVMEACAFNSGRMGVRSGLAAALAAAVSLGSGAPLGREGPVSYTHLTLPTKA